MKTLYLSCITSMVFLNAFSQTYQSFNKNRPAYYEFANTYDIFYTQAAISIDSFKVVGTDTIFYHYPIIDLENDPCNLKAHDSSFVNTESHRTINGDDIFFNRNHDTILFSNSAVQNESWIMYHFANGDVIKATVQSIDETAVLGINDNVKTITLQAQNSSGNNINHIFNGKKFLTGKNTGLVRGYSMFHFPADTIAFSIIGIENPSLGLNASELSPAKIFDFNVGDRFDYSRGQGQEPTMHTSIWEIDKIVTKQISLNGDTITYGVSFQNYTSGNNWNDYFEYTSSGIKEWVFELSSLGFLAMRPFQYFEKDYESHYHFLVPGSVNLTATDLQDKPYNFMLDWQYTDCLNGTVATLYTDDFYSSGLGMTSSYGGYIGSGAWSYDNLVYYNRNGIEWGDSINWNVLTGIENVSSKISYAVYPNPAEDFILIEGNFTTTKTEFTIFNTLGKEMPLKNTSFEDQSIRLDLTSLSPGVYFLILKNEGKTVTSKFMKE